MKIIYKKIINLFFFIIYGKIKIKKKYTKDISLKKISLDSNQFIKLYIIKKCRIYTDCNTNVAYISKNLIIPKISYQQNKNIVSTVKFNSSLKYGTPKFKTYYKGNIFSLLQGSSGSNYWHWLYDIMPKIEIMHKNGYLKRIDFFYVPDVNKFILETLKLYGIKKNQLINSKYLKHIVADQIYAFEHLYIKEGNFVNAFEKATGVNLNYCFGDRRDGDIVSAYADTTKANKILGWKAQLSPKDALISAWKWEKSLRT